MAPEGMVHALQTIHRLLAPGGFLIDIHPSGNPPPVEITLGKEVHVLGSLQETDDFVEYFQANTALEQAVQDGLFALERQELFTFLTHAESPAELRRYLEENWSDVLWPAEIDQNAARVASRMGPSKMSTVLRDRVRISRFRRLDPPLTGFPSR